MANNDQVDGSARAVQYLNQDATPEITQRPNINVPLDVNYNLQRFLNPHLHAEGQHLRPPQSPTPLSENESRMRMTSILSSMGLDTLPKQK
ncbi:uncharacterized protein F4817DRAFT_323080 [Daldinia loculata]|uniref:uncharacterized protein n=1 Tax=Daldinia loculata TaxID=103429 RepID=UPI0020C2EBB3|nr:uncharacterized protein F4817DRAFT_323080 [Daldinia loculata]KAI1652350.1 hypothetical protein F4817DRAFT_323080 [Daldinia loculata]